MTIESSLRVIAHRLCALLECSGVVLSLTCPPSGRHPLLTMFTTMQEDNSQHPFAVSNISDLSLLFAHEQVQQLLHDAFQEQAIVVHFSNDCMLQVHDITFKSIVAVPLERSAGLLGFLVCVDIQSDKFLQGECSLLEQAKPAIAREVEVLLSDAVTLLSQEEQESCPVPSIQEQQTLVSLVGHDLRMPLTAIKGYAGLLQAYGPTATSASAQMDLTPDLQQHYLDVIMEQTQHMEVLINDLLDVARLQRGQLALRNTWVNITSLCQRVVQIVQDKVDQQEAGQYHIRCRFATHSTLVWADPDRVQQVLTNLVENAVKYSPNGGLIEVWVRSHSLSSVVTIRDWGIGIPRQQQDSLFRVFRRGEQPMQAEIAGLGLGLYIARTLVEAMNGHIMLRSSERHGTCVSFTLPRQTVTEAQDQNTEALSKEFFNPCRIVSTLL